MHRPEEKWWKRVDEELGSLSQRVTLLAAATPSNLREERARLVELARRGLDGAPSWQYAPRDLSEVRFRLDALAQTLGNEELSLLYRAKIRELDLEARICERAGTRDVAALAAQRFAVFDPSSAAQADLLADAWIGAQPEDGGGDTPPLPALPLRGRMLATDDPHPDSLLSRLRAEVGRRRIPFAVAVHPHLSALAATGHRTVLVAAGRRIDAETVRRTVLHEIEGHVMPRVRAALAPLGLFSLGTARSTDEQEGYALVLEERHGFHGATRRRELAARHVAARQMERGASFAEVVRHLVGILEPHDAVVTAERAFRGSDGRFPGLGRERVYLESFVRVRAHLVRAPEDERILGSGQIALDAIAALRPYAVIA